MMSLKFKLLERLTLYLPTILMGLMALGTYWLVRSTPSFSSPQAQEAVRHDPDFELEKFAIKTFDTQGQLRSELFGDKARHFPDRDTVEVEQVKILSFNAKGHVTTATANKAIANSDASEVQLIGNAHVIRAPHTEETGQASPKLSYRSEFLHAYMNEERFTSNKPVELVRGDDRFTALGMDFNSVDQVIQLQGRVRGTLTPKKEK